MSASEHEPMTYEEAVERLSVELRSAESCVYAAHQALLREELDTLGDNVWFAPNYPGANIPYVVIKETDEEELTEFLGEKHAELEYLLDEAEDLGVER